MKSILTMTLGAAMLLYAAPLLTAADAVPGKELFAKRCAPCHGAEGEGKESVAKMLKVEIPHLGSTEVQAKTDEQLRKQITEGSGKMKPVKDLDAKALDDLIGYMRTLAKK